MVKLWAEFFSLDAAIQMSIKECSNFTEKFPAQWPCSLYTVLINLVSGSSEPSSNSATIPPVIRLTRLGLLLRPILFWPSKRTAPSLLSRLQVEGSVLSMKDRLYDLLTASVSDDVQLRHAVHP